MREPRRVAITGLGAVTPLGSSVKSSWDKLCAGENAVGRIVSFDVDEYPVQIAAEVWDFDPAEYLSRQFIRRSSRMLCYGMVAGIQAMEDSGISINANNASRCGAVIGSGVGGLDMITDAVKTLLQKGPRKLSPFCIPGSIINMVSGNLANHFNLKGPNLSTATACSTATHAIALAARLITAGDCDLMLAGGTENSVTPLTVCGFASMRALSTRNDDPAAASRPWDRDRDGFVLADGAGILVLEEYQHALDRGAEIYCELAGAGLSSDAHHITMPPEDGAGAMRSMKLALENADLVPEQVGYINAHGTSTPLGDIAETNAIKALFGENTTVPVSSNKSMFGHALGAAGGIEAVFTTLTLQQQKLPPTINLDNPAPDCDLDYVPNVCRAASVDAALSNSFGFGGTNGTLVFKNPE